MIDLPFLRF